MQEKNTTVTPLLFEAISSGDVTAVESLLSKGISPNEKIQIDSSSPKSPLNIAIEKGSIQIVKLLLDRGANVNAEDEKEKTPLHYATSRHVGVKQDVAKQIVSLLLDNGANINARDKDGSSPLHMASSARYVGIVEFLLSQGGDRNAKDILGETPLHKAILTSFELKDIYKLVEVLLNHGADVNAQNNRKETPLHMAVRGISDHYHEVAELLIQSGAHTNILDMYGRIPEVTKNELCLKEVAVPDRDSYYTIMRNLNERIETVEKQINAFKFSKETKNVIYLPEPPMEGLSSEEIIFIAQAKAESRGEHTIDRQYLLLDNMPNFNKLSSEINESIKNKIPFGYYIIMHFQNPPYSEQSPFSGRHCTPLRIDYNGQDIKYAYIDTLPDRGNIHFIKKLYNETPIEEKEEISYTPTGNIFTGKIEGYFQRDRASCSIFAIQDLNTMSKINRDDLSKYITPELEKLYPRFVKNSQNLFSLQKNLQKDDHKSEIVGKGKTLQEHIEEFCVETKIWDNNTRTEKVKTQNMAIYDKTLKYLNAAKKTLENIYTLGGEPLVQKIMSQRAGNKIFEFPKYTTIQKNTSRAKTKRPS